MTKAERAFEIRALPDELAFEVAAQLQAAGSGAGAGAGAGACAETDNAVRLIFREARALLRED